MSHTLGGAVCIRNGVKYDFCFREAIHSLLPVCDEVVVCIGSGGEDETESVIRGWADREPKIKVCIYEWPNPVGDNDFWVNWLNFAREHLSTTWHFQLDADEVLHENSYEIIREFIKIRGRSAICTRYNFWKDHRHIIPDGVCLGKFVNRLAPQQWWMPSDGYHPKGETVARHGVRTSIEIMHYGFIRKPDEFFAKERELQTMFFNSYDPRLRDAEPLGKEWMSKMRDVDWLDRVDPFESTHPAIMNKWLEERGFYV